MLSFPLLNPNTSSRIRDNIIAPLPLTILVNTNVFTPSEIRAIWGLDPLTEKQSEEIEAVLNKPSHTDSVTEDLLRENPESPTGDMETGGQRGRNINQRGDL